MRHMGDALPNGEECNSMPSPDDPDSPTLQRAIVLMQEALGILDTLELNVAAAKLAGALDVAREEKSKGNL